MEDPERVKEQFELLGKKPGIWHDQALELRRVAGLVWDRIEVATGDEQGDWGLAAVGDIAMMLEGLAVEVLIKAILVRVKPEKLVVDGTWKETRHDLLKLMRDAGVEPVSKLERDLLARLTAFVEWSGRYPIPLSYMRLAPKMVGKRAIEIPPGTYYSTADRDNVDALFARLEAVLDA